MLALGRLVSHLVLSARMSPDSICRAVNAHELAIISGMAAAYAVGAEYPKELEEDKFALLCFRLYLLLSHGKWYKKGSNRQ